MLDIVPPPTPIAAVSPSSAHPRGADRRGMDEPGIFKGCSEADGPLAEATKRAILVYLGKPDAAGWSRLRERAIAGATTLGDAWAIAAPAGTRRHPNGAELIRAIRVAVVAHWAGGVVGPLNRH